MGLKDRHDEPESGRDERSTGDTADGPQDEEGVLVGQEGYDEVEDTEGDEAERKYGLGREEVRYASPEEEEGAEGDGVGGDYPGLLGKVDGQVVGYWAWTCQLPDSERYKGRGDAPVKMKKALYDQISMKKAKEKTPKRNHFFFWLMMTFWAGSLAPSVVGEGSTLL